MKKRILIFVCSIFFIFTETYSQQDVNGWYWLNGKPTGNTLRWIKIISPDNIVAVGARGTFMKSVDGGDTWMVNSQVGSPDISTTGNLATLTLRTGWFFDANTGIVAGQSLSSSNGRISRTTDGGNTWNYIQYNSQGGTVSGLHFINSLTGYITGNNGAKFLKTTDQGLTWQNLSTMPGFPIDNFTSVFALDTGNIYLTSSDTKTVYNYKTSTGWTSNSLPGPFAILSDIIFKDANTGYTCGNGNYFAYTLNGGANWTQHNSSSNEGQQDMVYTGGVLYMAGNYNYYYKSVNNGVTWDSVYFHDASNPNQPPGGAPGIIYGMDVNGSDIALVGLNGILNFSNDNGASWRNKNYSVTNNYGATTYSSILVQTNGAVSGSNVGNIWLGPQEGGRIFFSSNAGANWVTKPTSSTNNVLDIQFINSNTGYICGAANQMEKTTNGGNNWTLLSLPTPMNTYQLNNLSFINPNTGWASGFKSPFDPSLIFKTTNGGGSWVNQTLQGNPNGGVVSVHMLDANTGYALGFGLYSTTNGGTNWIASTNPYLTGVYWYNMTVMSKDIIYLTGPGTSGTKQIVRSVDGGNTWTDLTSGTLPNLVLFNCKWLNLKHGIAFGSNGYIGKTTNGGITWSESNPGGSTIVDASIPNKNEVYAVSDRNSAYEVWRKYDYLTSVSVNVTMGIEGFWNGKPMVTDTVTLELHNSTSPFVLVDQAKEVVTINGYATYKFYNAPAGTYYVVLKHRNSLETWSANPITMYAAGNYNYNFTSSASQAFGSNQIFKAGINCIYSGDVNQDGIIDASDLAMVENAVGTDGYLPEDVTGDNYVDAGDVAILENNQGNTVSAP